MTPVTRSPRAVLAVAAVAVAFAAADTYVVVLALPAMMADAGIPAQELQRAAPLVSGFLLGYVAMLPLIGRVADLRGRVPVLLAALVLFAVGSLITALAFDLPTMVGGRFLQGVGGGGLVPATLALVADLYPAERRGVPLGVVSAVQELGAVLGPLFGAGVLAVSGWRAIFAVNLLVGVVLALALRRLAREPGRRAGPRLRDPVGLVLLGLLGVAAGLLFLQPAAVMRDLTWGQMYVPLLGSGRWTTPVGLVTLGLVVLLLVWWTVAPGRLVDLRGWWRHARAADLPGAVLFALVLGGVILSFATADPKVQLLAPLAPWFLGASAVALVLLVVHLRTARTPLLPPGTLRARPAWGSLVVSFLVGAALIAALIDIPLFARTTIHPDSQLSAALVLLQLLVALPPGAVLGGYLSRSLPAGVVTALGMLLAAGAFWVMSGWGADALRHTTATLTLLVGGFGFGLALAPVNAAMLASTRAAAHGLAAAFVVVARMVGMLVGISALTAIGLRRYYAEAADIPPVQQVCDGQSRCPEFTELLTAAGIAQEQVVFAGAAVCAATAAVAALLLFRGAPTRALDTGQVLRSGG